MQIEPYFSYVLLEISVTFIVLQVLGSMSILPGNQSSISSNLPGDHNDKSKDQNINDPVNIRHLNKDKAENILMEGTYILIHLCTCTVRKCLSNGLLFLFCSWSAFFVKGQKENESPKSEERLKQEQINSADNSNGYKEHPEVVLLPEDPGIDILSIWFIKSHL